MQTLREVDLSIATGKTKELFGAIEQRLKRVPNMMRLMGNSPAILGAYLRFNESFEETRLTAKLRGLISAVVAEIHGCDYTLSVAFALGPHEGLTSAELNGARRAEASEPRSAAVLQFVAKVVRERGRVPASDVEELRNTGFTNEEIVEIIGAVVLNIFRNYFNLIAGTEVDFPLVKTSHGAGS